MSQLFASGGQSTGVSVSASVLPKNTQDWSPLGWTGWISLVQGTLKSLLQHHSSKASILHRSAFFIVQLSHPYMTTGKTITLTRRTFAGKVMSLLFNMLSRPVTTFLSRSKRLLISWLQSPSAVILEPKKIKSDIVSTVSPSISHEVMGPDATILVFWMLSFNPTFSLMQIYTAAPAEEFIWQFLKKLSVNKILYYSALKKINSGLCCNMDESWRLYAKWKRPDTDKYCIIPYIRAFHVAQTVKNPHAMQETEVRFLGWKDPLEEGMAICSSILAWEIP